MADNQNAEKIKQTMADAKVGATKMLNALGNKFAVAKQWTKVKMGKAEQSQESPEFAEMIARLRNTRDTFKAMMTAAKEAEAHYQKLIASQNEFAQSLSCLQFEAKQENLATYIQVQKALQTNNEQIHRSFKELVLDPLHALQEGELEAALQAKKKYEKCHLDLDAFNSELDQSASKSADKVAAATAAVQKATEQYNTAKADLIVKCEALERKKSEVLDGNVGKYLHIQTSALDDSSKASRGAGLNSAPIGGASISNVHGIDLSSDLDDSILENEPR